MSIFYRPTMGRSNKKKGRLSGLCGGIFQSKGGHNDNPTVKEFCDDTVSLRVQRTAALHPVRGNCAKRGEKRRIEVDNTPLRRSST